MTKIDSQNEDLGLKNRQKIDFKKTRREEVEKKIDKICDLNRLVKQECGFEK